MKQPASPYTVQIELPENTAFNETANHTNQIIDAVMSIAPDAKITIQRNSIGSALADAAQPEHPETHAAHLLTTLNENIEKMYAASRATPAMLLTPKANQPTYPDQPLARNIEIAKNTNPENLNRIQALIYQLFRKGASFDQAKPELQHLCDQLRPLELTHTY